MVFGDSYAAEPLGYARILPPMLLRRGCVEALGGTGFTATDPSRKRAAYYARLNKVRDCDEILVQASGNDAKHPVAQVAADADSFISALPRMPVWVLGPMWALDGSENLPELDEALGCVAQQHGLRYIRALGWLTEADMRADGAHPTLLAHAKIARRIRAAIVRP